MKNNKKKTNVGFVQFGQPIFGNPITTLYFL